MVSRDSPWRSLGSVTYAFWRDTIKNAGGRPATYSEESWRAAGEHSALVLALMYNENKYDTTYRRNKPVTNNVLSIRVPDRSNEDNEKGYIHFPSVAEGIRVGVDRLLYQRWWDEHKTSNLPKTNPYLATETISDLLYVFSPPGPDGEYNHTEDLVEDTVRNLSSYVYEKAGAEMAPKIIDKWLHVTQDGYAGVIRYIPNRNGKRPRVIVIHIQQGTNWGSWQHFHSVTASSTVLIGRNGDIWRLVPEQHGPWTNGDYCSPTTKGTQIMNQFGWSPNEYSLTIETEGFSFNGNAMGWLAWPKPQAQLDSVLWQVRDWMSRYDIDAVYVVRHADFNQCSRSDCPGNQFYNYIIDMLKAGGAPVVVPEAYVDPQPIMVNGELWDGTKDVVINGITFHADKRKIKVGPNGVNRRQWADDDAGMTGKALEPHSTANVLGWVRGEKVADEDRWWIGEAGSRVWVGGTVDKPGTTPTNPKENPFDKVINGIKFHAIRDDGKPHEVTVMDDLNVRKWATTSAPIKFMLTAGQKVQVTHWVVGQNFAGNDVWLVTADDDRIWSGGTNFQL